MIWSDLYPSTIPVQSEMGYLEDNVSVLPVAEFSAQALR